MCDMDSLDFLNPGRKSSQFVPAQIKLSYIDKRSCKGLRDSEEDEERKKKTRKEGKTNLVRQRGESTVKQIQHGDLSGKLSVTWETFAAKGQTHSKLRFQPCFRDAQFLSELGADLLGDSAYMNQSRWQ